MRIDNARFTGSVDGSEAIASLSGSFTGSGHIELSNTASYNFSSASISASNLILWRGSGVTGQTSSLAIISQTSDTASYVSSSNVDGPFGMDSIVTSSYAVSASHAQTSSFAVSASHLIGLQHSITASFTAQTTFTANHNFDSEDVVVQVYQDDAATGNIPTMIVPDTITLPNRNQATVTFAVATTGYVVVSRGGFLRSGSIQSALTASIANAVQNPLIQGLGINTFSYDGGTAGVFVQVDTSSAHFLSSSVATASFVEGNRFVDSVTNAAPATFNVTHNLGESFPIVQSYDSGGNMVIPVSVVIVNANQVDVTFAAAFTGNIVVQK